MVHIDTSRKTLRAAKLFRNDNVLHNRKVYIKVYAAKVNVSFFLLYIPVNISINEINKILANRSTKTTTVVD